MFDNIIPKILQPEKVFFDNPKFLTLQFKDAEDKVVSFEKGASNYLYKALELKEGTSNEVFKKSIDLWKNLINLCEERSSDSKYNFHLNKDTNLFFVTDSNDLIDIYDASYEENVNHIKEKYEQFKLDITERTKTCKMYTEGKDGLLKIIIFSSRYDINDEYTPIVLLELNTKKSQYIVYTGILMFSSYILIPNFSVFNT